jgi:hypothetical protein
MTRSEIILLREYVERWRRTGPELEAIRREELRSFDHAADWRLIDGLLAAGLRRRDERVTSGMVEMQKWFRRLAERRKPRTMAGKRSSDGKDHDA